MILKPFFNRVGSKVSLIKDIIPVIPPHTTYVEPFVGGGAIFWNKTPAEKSVINDLDKELITGYKILKRISPKTDLTFLDNAKKVDGKFPEIEKFIESVNKNSTDGDKLLRIMKLLNGTFNSKGIGKIYKNPSTESKMDDISEYKKLLKSTTILNKDYLQVIKEYDSPTTFFFLDPPYEDSDKSYYKNITIDYNEMSDALKKIKGKFLLTINDSKIIRDKFKDFIIKTIVVRNPANTDFGEETRNRKELFITNYNMKQGGSVETDNFNDKEIVSIPEFKSVKMTLPTYMYKRLPDIDGKPPLYKYKLVIPITSSRNISSRKAEKSIVINQKPVAKAIVSIDKNKEKPTLDDFSPEDQDKLTEYYDKVEENENKSPDEIQNDSYKIVPRGKPLPCPNVKKSKKEKPVKEKVVKEKGVKGRPKKPKKEIVLQEYDEETGSYEPKPIYEPPKEKEDTLDKEDEDLLLNNYEEFKKKYGLESKKGKGLENIVSTDNIKMPANKWVEYVKSYSSKHNMSYRDALRDPKCKAGYKKKGNKKVGGAAPQANMDFNGGITDMDESSNDEEEEDEDELNMLDTPLEYITSDFNDARYRWENSNQSQADIVNENQIFDRDYRELFNLIDAFNMTDEDAEFELRNYFDWVANLQPRVGGGKIKKGKGVVDELSNQELIAEIYNMSQLGANAGKKYISL
jgi:DNA adenine methylase